MERVVECVPNFSEGRDTSVVARLAEAVESVEGALVLGTHVDPDHNRSVVTFVAPPDIVVEAAVRVVARAAEMIDLSLHAGQHPRMGACDVLPFVPVRGVTVAECVALARRAGERIWNELGIPVYFYESAALREERRNLADVRRGGFELLREQIATDPRRAPDVGEPRIHATAGACIVGVRPLLIAYNITLDTRDLSIAKLIARRVRERDGGLMHLKALGFELESRGVVQVSMNLTSYEQTNLHQAFEVVRREAESLGVEVIASEIVGLVPQAALNAAARYFLKIENYSPELVLENRIAAALERKRGEMGGEP
ncbi:MAG: glutamate formiminotransferase / formiminotetrahydrofolate cyclodeaminase [Acidobacteriota bacterium]|jgi:glutamate formiminotransferase|nr:glutamate formiminotransferase / formiminotetrahydrofolate cyclodeaminase [Acidobacteriota bacterium]